MTYILILLWTSGFSSQGTDSKTAWSIEFHDMNACRAAAEVVIKSTKPKLAYCVAKGTKS